MKIAILHPSYAESSAPFKDFDPQCDPARYLPEHACTPVQVLKTTAVRQMIALSRQGFDVLINLCDGAWEEDRPGIEVVQALEKLNLAFTGAGSTFYEPTREAMKMACHSADVRFPAYAMVQTPQDVDLAVKNLQFPLIVKHPNSYSSIGMTADSRVTSAEDLHRQVQKMTEEFGAALIEEFIEGREFTVLVGEARHDGEEAWALQPVEFRFPPGETFKHFALKWQDFVEMTTHPVTDPQLAARLQQASALTFAALGGTGYGRCDLRMDADGEIYVLEINPNCGIFYPEGQFGSADVILAHDPAGHRGFLLHLLECALRRQNHARRRWEVRYERHTGFGLFAREAIPAGALVERYEERAQVLASTAHVEKHWKGLKKQWFASYAWPLTADLHVLWDADPAEWRPLNHSCDPNTWLEGLNVVARREVAAGEALTLDYATFCGPNMADFACTCGAKTCRHVVLARDHLDPHLRARYGTHVSAYVQAQPLDMPAEFVVKPVETEPTTLEVVAQRAWQPGEIVAPLTWHAQASRPSRFSLQIGANAHAEPRPFALRYVNHSCAPNVHFDVDRHHLRALRPIAPGDPLRAFYPATEMVMAEPFACHCGAMKCLGLIQGARHLPPEVLGSYPHSSIVAASLR